MPQKLKWNKNFYITCLLALFAVLLFLPGARAEGKQGPGQAKIITRSAPGAEEEFVVGKVRKVGKLLDNRLLQKATGMQSQTQLVEIEILEGKMKGKTVIVPNEVTDNPSFNIRVSPQSEVVLSIITDPQGETELNIADYHRAPALFILATIFVLAFIACGGRNGLKSLLGLAIAIALIGWVLLPLSLHGINPLYTAVLICITAAAATILLVTGKSKKSAAALGGTFGGVVISGIAAELVIRYAPLTGLASEEAQILRGSMNFQAADFFTGLLAASMLVGALGVIMDVAISVASTVSEVSAANTNLSSAELFTRGMNVGRDIMGSMVTTLILAYAGGALPLLLLLASTPSSKLINLDLVATEIASSLAGSLGLVCTIPLTAWLAARLLGKRAGHV